LKNVDATPRNISLRFFFHQSRTARSYQKQFDIEVRGRPRKQQQRLQMLLSRLHYVLGRDVQRKSGEVEDLGFDHLQKLEESEKKGG
jgi:hypothetical protein